jgi:L-serine dehydratase
MGEFLPDHANALRFVARYADRPPLEGLFYSVGGGAIAEEGVAQSLSNIVLPLAFATGAELLDLGAREGLSIAEMVMVNETAWRPNDQTEAFLDAVRAAMLASIERGCRQEGLLPGPLKVRRCAVEVSPSLDK